MDYAYKLINFGFFKIGICPSRDRQFYFESKDVWCFMLSSHLALAKDVINKLPDLMTKVNSFDDLNKSINFFIKSTTNIT